MYYILPLIAFFANVFLGIYILYKNPESKINGLYALFTFALAIWAFADFLVSISPTPQIALSGNKFGTFGSSFMSAFLLHFFLLFTKNRLISKKIFIVALYLPAFFFILIRFTTNMMTKFMETSWWGYAPVTGKLYGMFTLYLVTYVSIGLFLCYNLYKKSSSVKEKIQARNIIFAIFIPLVGGTITQIIPLFIGLKTIQLTTTLTTFTAVIIAYSMFRYRLMIPITFSLHRKIIIAIFASGVIGLLFMGVIYYFSAQNVSEVNLIIMASVMSGVFMFISYFIARSLSNPLRKLAEGVNIIGTGNLDYKINIKTGDEIGHLATAFNNMTNALKKSNAVIESHAKDLEIKVKQRTKELDAKIDELTSTKTAILNMMEDMDETNKSLIKIEDELKRMNVKKDEFISIAAHELKTPLTAIHGFSQLLLKKGTVKNINLKDKYLKIMDSETKRLAKLVNDILDLSRIDLGTIKVNIERIDVKSVVKDVKREMNIPVNKKGLKLESKIDKNVLYISTDKEKLMQILINLINNSVKYTENGSIKIDVVKNGDFIQFSVEDTGIGISAEEQKKIFNRFYQVDSSFTRKAGGTGLGLSLCNEFVTILGGKIWVESEVGKGSKFYFTVPAKGISKGIKEEKMKPLCNHQIYSVVT